MTAAPANPLKTPDVYKRQVLYNVKKKEIKYQIRTSPRVRKFEQHRTVVNLSLIHI